MSFHDTESIVLKGMKYNDSSKIVSLYTKDLGKINALIKGVRSSRSNQCGNYEDFNHIKIFFNYKSNRDLQVINKSECLNSFDNIKISLEKLELAYIIIGLISKLNHEYDVNFDIFDLLVKSLSFLNEDLHKNISIYVYFLINFIELSGISLKSGIEKETKTSDKISETFYSSYGLSNNKDIYIRELRFMIDKGINKINNYNISTEILENIRDYLDDYVNFHFDVKNIYTSKYIFKKINELT